MFKIAINGYGRIGQSVLRAIYESSDRADYQVVAINSLTDIDTLTYMTRYDTTHGRFPVAVEHDGENLLIDGDVIRISAVETPEDLNWDDLDIDLLFECSGTFGDRKTANRYLQSGAKRLLFSQPGEPDMDATIVYGMNHEDVLPEHKIVSAASCTTNCIVPVIDVLDKKWGVVNGLTTTIHSAMNDQPMIDSSNAANLRLSRSGLQSIIPVTTSLAKGIERLLPHLAGKFDCLHVRVPTMNVSAIDLSINLESEASVNDINEVLQKAAKESFPGLMAVSQEPHASVDFNHDAHSVIIDGTQTRVNSGTSVKLFCWFDNEWAYANRMVDISTYWLKKSENVQ